MSLSTGTRLGPYEILSPIGAGGMGEVFKARDTRLDRTVAIKVLPPALAADPQFRERFEREARSISQLNHPNICTLYDVGEVAPDIKSGAQGAGSLSRQQDPSPLSYLVMEFLEGETLAARIAKGALPLADALRIAIEIAGALDKAHRQGIVHRDLKPGNVMLTKTGAKLLDFGLAKIGPAAALSNVTTMPTVTAPLTAQGTILGTFQYMAPEQIEGEEADARADIFAFGALVFEMLTGRKAFAGKTQASLFGAILKDEPPPVSQIVALAPPALDHVVRTCLAKDRDVRFQTAHDLLLQLRWIQEGGSAVGVPAPVAGHRKRRERVAWIALAVVAALFLVTLVPALLYFRTAPEPARMQFAVPTPETQGNLGALGMAVSPDGRVLAYIGALDYSGSNVVWIRPLDGAQARPLPATAGATWVFWAPDSQRVGFVTPGKLRTIDVSGSRAQDVCALEITFNGGTWNAAGDIVFAKGGTTAALYRVRESGGSPVEIARADASRHETALLYPRFLPDGRHFLYLSRGNDLGRRAIYAGSIDGGAPVMIVAAESMPLYASGWLLYLRGGSLLAQMFDAARLRVIGEPVSVAEGILGSANTGGGRAAFSVSDTGLLVFRTGTAGGGLSDLVWVGRDGKAGASVGDPRAHNQIRLSPDEKRVVFSEADVRGLGTTLWTIDLSSNITSQLTVETPNANDPVWAPDSETLAFEATPKNVRNFYQQAVGSRSIMALYESAEDPKWLDDWSRDGQFLLFHVPGPGRLFSVPSKGGAPTLLTESKVALDAAHFSPDSKWVAYETNESGAYEVWVATFPGFDHRRQVSAHGGGQPFWRGDGHELYYLAPDGKMMAVAAAPNAAQPAALDFRAPVPLFQSPLSRPNLTIDQYSVTRDGQRFLFIQPRREENAAAVNPFTVVVNWTTGLKK